MKFVDYVPYVVPCQKLYGISFHFQLVLVISSYNVLFQNLRPFFAFIWEMIIYSHIILLQKLFRFIFFISWDMDFLVLLYCYRV